MALGFLERDGEGPNALYRNTAETRLFLDRQSPGCISDRFAMVNARLYRFWGDLTEALKTGQPQNESKRTGVSMFEELYRDPQRLEQFLESMADTAAAPAAALADKFTFVRYRTLCDVGGASGQLAITVASRHPHLHCMTTDLPVVTPIAARKIAAAGLAERVTAQALGITFPPTLLVLADEVIQ